MPNPIDSCRVLFSSLPDCCEFIFQGSLPHVNLLQDFEYELCRMAHLLFLSHPPWIHLKSLRYVSHASLVALHPFSPLAHLVHDNILAVMAYFR